jgi:hypothetical protein
MAAELFDRLDLETKERVEDGAEPAEEIGRTAVEVRFEALTVPKIDEREDEGATLDGEVSRVGLDVIFERMLMIDKDEIDGNGVEVMEFGNPELTGAATIEVGKFD